MEMKDFITKIEYIISKHGKSIVQEKRFVNILKDLYDFRYDRKLIEALYSIYEIDGIQALYTCPKKDLQNVIDKMSEHLSATKKSYDKNDFSLVLYSFAIALGMIDLNDYKNIGCSKPSSFNKRWKDIISFLSKKHFYKFKINGALKEIFLPKQILYCHIAFWLTFMLTTLILYYFVVNLESFFWSVVCVCCIDCIYLGKILNSNFNHVTETQDGVFLVYHLWGLIKSVLILFLVSQGDSILGTFLAFIIVCIWGFILIGSGILDKKSWKQSCFRRVFICSLVVISPFSIIWMSTNILPRMTNNSIKNVILIAWRSNDNRSLGYKQFRLKSSLDIAQVGTLNDYTVTKEKSQLYSQILSFKDSLNGDNVKVSVYLRNNIIMKISINDIGDHYDILKLYTEKYGTAETRVNKAVEPFFDEYHWTYPDGTIKLEIDADHKNKFFETFLHPLWTKFCIIYESSDYIDLERKIEENKLDEIKKKEQEEEQQEKIQELKMKEQENKKKLHKEQQFEKAKKVI